MNIVGLTDVARTKQLTPEFKQRDKGALDESVENVMISLRHKVESAMISLSGKVESAMISLNGSVENEMISLKERDEQLERHHRAITLNSHMKWLAQTADQDEIGHRRLQTKLH